MAALRAMGARERDPALVNPDDLAEGFLSGWMRWAVRFAPVRTLVDRVLAYRIPGIYPFITARTKFFDAALLHEIDAGARQLVILGAGADSRAHRFAARLGSVVVFELDHPATSAWKRRRVAARGLAGTVIRVPIDFGATSLAEAFDEYDVDRDKVTVFLWEGVVPYLNATSVESTLAQVARFPAGSSLVFDYLYAGSLDDPPPGSDAAKYQSYLARHGEPLTFTIDAATMPEYLGRFGLTVEDHAHPDDLSRDYLDGERHTVAFSAIVRARVA